MTGRGSLTRALSLLLGAGLALAAGSAGSAQDPASLPDPLSLSDVLALARSRRPDVQAMEWRAEAAARRPRIVSAPPDPRVFASADHVPLTMPGIDFSGGVEMSAPLGRVLHHRSRVAEALAEGRREDVARMALEVELDAAIAFYRLRYVRALDSLLGDQITLVEQLLAGATARYSAGLGSQAEVLRVQAERARIGSLVRAVEGLRLSAEGGLNVAIGRSPGAGLPSLSETPMGLPPTLDAAMAEARAERPELRSNAAAVEAAASEIEVMRGMYRPMVMGRLGAAYTMREGPGLMGMVGFSVPIFRGRLRAGVSEARAMRGMAEAELDASTLRIEGEVAIAFGQYVAAQARARALHDEVVPLARQAVDAMLAEYAAGRVPLVAPIEAARTLFASEVESLDADMEVGIASARVLRSIGRAGGTDA